VGVKKATKGAVAAGIGGVLLLGGAGTVAFWTDNEPITGGTIASGHLRIVTDGTNQGCGAWELDTAESAPTAYTVGQPLVPGDVLTRDCAFTVQATGNHLRATVGISAVNFSGAASDFGGQLHASVSAVKIGGTPVSSFTEADDGGTLTASVSVTFDSAAPNGTEDLATFLDSLTLTATQVHA
jgi:alternate signal-mediated exported protein